jgi:hypothetical protein
MNDATDALSFKFKRLDASLGKETTIAGKSKLIDAFLNELVRLGVEKLVPSRMTFVYERIASLLSIPMDDVGQELRARRPLKQTTQNQTSEQREINPHISTFSKARQIAEREFLSILLFDPTETSAALRESDFKIKAEDFLDPISNIIASFIFPKLESGALFTMAEVTVELDTESENVASTLYFVGERICNTYGNVLHSFNMTKNALNNAIEKQAIEDEVKSVQTTIDTEQKTIAAKLAIDSIRRQKTLRETT